MYNELIFLLKEHTERDAIGQSETTYTQREVFARKKPITQNEFRIATGSGQPMTGIRPSACFEMNFLDYEGEEVIRADDVLYRVYRQYPTFQKVELYCEVRSGLHEHKD